MIRKVRFSNFYSFYKEQEINFLAKKKKRFSYFNSDSGDQITKVAAFVGGNASGKTNAMRFFSFLSYFICRNADENDALPDIAYKTFFFNGEKSVFHIEFEKSSFIFFYSVEIKKGAIASERLSAKKIEKYSREEVVFSRKKGDIHLNGSHFKNIDISSLPVVRDDVSFVAFIRKMPFSVDMIDIVYDFFAGFKSNINEKGDINNMFHKLSSLNTYMQDKGLKKEMEYFIRNFDIGLQGFEISQSANNEKEPISVRGIHDTSSSHKEIDLAYESRGTQSLFFALAKILSALKNNDVIIVDEIEAGFHPEALNKLISYFIDENKEGRAQLIFSSHSLEFMNKLDMHQIFLSEKDKQGESSITRLNEVDGVRTDENFLARYMAGAYGGFPRIRV